MFACSVKSLADPLGQSVEVRLEGRQVVDVFGEGALCAPGLSDAVGAHPPTGDAVCHLPHAMSEASQAGPQLLWIPGGDVSDGV